jgi:[ribosomal protein S18]-alanine N-acetyltransferase
MPFEKCMMIEPMKPEHIDEVVAIEQVSFPDPWSRRMFEKELAFPAPNAYVMKHETGGIVGYSCFRSAGDTADIMNLAVKPGCYRQKIGAQLLARMLDDIKKMSLRTVYLEVRSDNTPAIALYEKYGFKQQRVRKNYYTSFVMSSKKNVEYSSDALEMVLSLPAHTAT